MSSCYDGHKIVIAIDPGFGGTGVSMLVSGKLYRFTNVKSASVGDNRYGDIASKCARHVLDWINDLRAAACTKDETYVSVCDIVVESPHAMGGVAGHASLMRGDVFTVAKLAGAIGVLLLVYITSQCESDHVASIVCVENNGAPVEHCRTKIRLHFPEVRKWKGQVSKETTQRRVLRDVKYALDYIKDSHYKLSEKYPDHVFDAVGLGMWFCENGSEYEN